MLLGRSINVAGGKRSVSAIEPRWPLQIALLRLRQEAAHPRRAVPGGELITEGDVAAATGLESHACSAKRSPGWPLRRSAEDLSQAGALVVPVSATEVETVLETRLLVEQFAIQKVISLDIDLGSAPHEAIPKQAEFAAEGELSLLRRGRSRVPSDVVAATDNSILLQLTIRCATASTGWGWRRCTATTGARPRRSTSTGSCWRPSRRGTPTPRGRSSTSTSARRWRCCAVRSWPPCTAGQR